MQVRISVDLYGQDGSLKQCNEAKKIRWATHVKNILNQHFVFISFFFFFFIGWNCSDFFLSTSRTVSGIFGFYFIKLRKIKSQGFSSIAKQRSKNKTECLIQLWLSLRVTSEHAFKILGVNLSPLSKASLFTPITGFKFCSNCKTVKKNYNPSRCL